MKKHRAAHVSIKCGLCPREFNFRKDYKTHHRNEHSNQRKTYQMVEETNNEIIITNQDASPEFQKSCNECNKVFYSRQGLAKHVCRKQLAAEDVAELVCGIDDCVFLTNDSREYYEHQAAMHAVPIDSKLKVERLVDTCHACNKSFKSRKGFKEHKCRGDVVEIDSMDGMSNVKRELEIGYEIVENEIVGSEVIIS